MEYQQFLADTATFTDEERHNTAVSLGFDGVVVNGLPAELLASWESGRLAAEQEALSYQGYVTDMRAEMANLNAPATTSRQADTVPYRSYMVQVRRSQDYSTASTTVAGWQYNFRVNEITGDIDRWAEGPQGQVDNNPDGWPEGLLDALGQAVSTMYEDVYAAR